MQKIDQRSDAVVTHYTNVDAGEQLQGYLLYVR